MYSFIRILLLVILFAAISVFFLHMAFDEIIDVHYFAWRIFPYLVGLVPICLFLLMFTDLPGKKKIAVIAYVPLLIILWFSGFIPFGECSIKRFFYSRQAKLEKIAKDIAEHDTIFQMTDGLRASKFLNNKRITFSFDDMGISKYNSNYTHYYLDLLKKELIDSLTYEQFRKKIIDMNLIDFEEKLGFIYFTRDGSISDSWGYLYAKGDSLPEVGRSKTKSGTIHLLFKLSENWYYFET